MPNRCVVMAVRWPLVAILAVWACRSAKALQVEKGLRDLHRGDGVATDVVAEARNTIDVNGMLDLKDAQKTSESAEKLAKLMDDAEKARSVNHEQLENDSFVPTVFLAVHSRLDNLAKRLSLRDTWRQAGLTKGVVLKFFMCMEKSAPVSNIIEENATFQDLLTMDCEETADQMTVPMQLELMRFYNDFHQDSTALVQVEDTAFVALERVRALLHQLGNSRAAHLYASVPVANKEGASLDEETTKGSLEQTGFILGGSLVRDILTSGAGPAASQETDEANTSAGLNAPLTQGGYERVTAQKSDNATREFVLRYLDASGRSIKNDRSSEDSLNGFVPFYSGVHSVQTFAGLRNELSTFPWVLPKTGRRSIPATELIVPPPPPLRLDARRKVKTWVDGLRRAGFNVEAFSLPVATAGVDVCGRRWSEVAPIVIAGVQEADLPCLAGLDRARNKDVVVDCLAACKDQKALAPRVLPFSSFVR